MYSLIETITELVRIPSIAGDRYNCELALGYLLEKGRDFGLSAKTACGGKVGIIEAGEGDEVLGIITHVDVAGTGNPKDWRYPPFHATVEEGRLYGRGVVDNKGACVTALFAMRDIHKTSYRRNIPMHKKVRMIIGTEKLTGGRDLRTYLALNPAPNYSFAPDGVFPVGNQIHGSMNILMSFPLSEDGRVLKDIKAGQNHETIPPICRVTLANGRKFAARGTAAHTVEYCKGSNAILNMAAALESLRSRERAQLKDDSIYRILRRIHYGFEDAEGLRAGMPHPRTPYRFEDPGANRFVPTALFISEGRLFLNLNAHFNIQTSEQEIISAVENYFRDYQMRVEKISSKPASFINRGEEFVREFQEAYEHVSGEPMEYRICSYDTYAQIVPNTITFGPVMPGSPDTRNQVNESISVRDLMFMQTLFERAMSNIVFLKQNFQEAEE